MLNTDIHIFIYIYIHLWSYIRCSFTSTQNSPFNRHLLAKYDFSVRNMQVFTFGKLHLWGRKYDYQNEEKWWMKKERWWLSTMKRNTCLEFLFKKVVLKNLLRKRLQHGRFPVNVLKFWRKPILKNICELLLLKFITAVLT